MLKMTETALDHFIESPEKSFREVSEFIEEVEETFRYLAEHFESQLEHNLISGGDLVVQNFRFWTIDQNKTSELIAKSLMIEYELDSNKLKQDIEDKTRRVYGEDLREAKKSSKKAHSIWSLYDFLERNEDEIKEWIGSDHAGIHYPQKSTLFGEQNGIVMEVIASTEIEKMAGGTSVFRKIKRSLPGFKSKTVKDNIDNYFGVLSPVIRESKCSKQVFKEVMLHELNHAYLDLKGDLNESMPVRLGGALSYENQTGAGSDDFKNAFNEIFAYYTSYVINGRKFEGRETDLYSRPDLIKWGLEILVDKTSELESRGKEEVGIDFCRGIMEKISDHDYPLAVFTNFCLLKQDKKRIKSCQKVLSEVESSYSNFTDKIEFLYHDRGEHLSRDDFPNLMCNGIAKNYLEKNCIPRHSDFQDNIIEIILSKTIENEKTIYPDLNQINEIITDIIEDEVIKSLDEAIEQLEIRRKKYDNSDMSQLYREMEENLLEYRNEIQEIKEEGMID